MNRRLKRRSLTNLKPNDQIGELTLLEYLGRIQHGLTKTPSWLVECSCGKQFQIREDHLVESKHPSCGHGLSNQGARLALSSQSQFMGTSVSGLSKKPYFTSQSGIRGVSYDQRQHRWIAKLVFKNKVVLFEYFKTKEQAVKARRLAEEKYLKPVQSLYQTYQQIKDKGD